MFIGVVWAPVVFFNPNGVYAICGFESLFPGRFCLTLSSQRINGTNPASASATNCRTNNATEYPFLKTNAAQTSVTEIPLRIQTDVRNPSSWQGKSILHEVRQGTYEKYQSQTGWRAKLTSRCAAEPHEVVWPKVHFARCPVSCLQWHWETILSSACTESTCTLPLRLPDPSPMLDKNRAPMGPGFLSSTGGGVWREAPGAFPDSSSVLDNFQVCKAFHPLPQLACELGRNLTRSSNPQRHRKLAYGSKFKSLLASTRCKFRSQAQPVPICGKLQKLRPHFRRIAGHKATKVGRSNAPRWPLKRANSQGGRCEFALQLRCCHTRLPEGPIQQESAFWDGFTGLSFKRYTYWGTSKQHMKQLLQQPRTYDFRVSQFNLPSPKVVTTVKWRLLHLGPDHHREAGIALTTTAKLQQLRASNLEMMTFAESCYNRDCNDRKVISQKLNNPPLSCMRFCAALWLLSFQVPWGVCDIYDIHSKTGKVSQSTVWHQYISLQRFRSSNDCKKMKNEWI